MKTIAALLFAAAMCIGIGFTAGYTHVIVNSEAYCVDFGDTLIMVVDGHVYQYEVSQQFYDSVLHR
jgi:formate/nitrite transporter FocA (FNT family)